MTRRGSFWVVILGFIGVGIAVLARPRKIGPESFRQIRAGMSEKQVEVVIGLPAGDYLTRPHTHWRGHGWGVQDKAGKSSEWDLWTREIDGQNVRVASSGLVIQIHSVPSRI